MVKTQDNKWTEAKWLISILIIAAALRMFNLGQLPFGFHNDEVMNGYVGRFILENGRDLYGNSWPILYFDNFGDYPNVIPMYLSGLFTYVFGVSEFGVRFPIALAGTLTVGVVYLICRWLFHERKVAILAAAALAIMPWHLVLSRATAEGVTASLAFVAGFGLVFWALEQKKLAIMLAGTSLLLLSYLLYPGFRILAPLGYLSVVALANSRRWRLISLGLCCLLMLTTFAISQTAWGKGRFDQTSVFTHNNVIGGKALQYATGLGENKIFQARLFHNKLVLSGQEIVRQYASYFSPQFLFSTAGKPDRYSIPEQGVYLYTFLLVIIGAIALQMVSPLPADQLQKIFNPGRSKFFFGFCWLLLISPISAALTLEDVPNVHRSVPMAVFSVIILGACLAIWLRRLEGRAIRLLFTSLVVVAALGEFSFFWHYYSSLSRMTGTLARSEERRTVANWLLENGNNYTTIFATSGGALPIHYLFHGQNFSPDLVGKFRSGLRLDSVDNLVLQDQDCFHIEAADERLLVGKVAIVVQASCDQPSWLNQVVVLNYSDQKAAYRIFEPDREKLTAILATQPVVQDPTLK